MAYAALVSLAQTTLLILNPDKYPILTEEKEKIESIREYVIFLISYLEDFPEKARRLEGQIREIANGTEDIMEQFMWMQIQSRDIRLTLSRLEFLLQLRKSREEIGQIAGELMDDRPCESPASVSSSSSAPTGKTNDAVIGLDEDQMAIKERLCGESSKLQVIPIVGMAGIGKTTLARNAFDDQLIIEYFQIRVWVTVSQDYSQRRTLLGLLDAMKLLERQGSNEFTIAQMVEKVYKNLKGRRYLLVFDDIWSTEAWDDVRRIIPDDNNGSRIMLTTRLSNVAAYAGSCSPLHEMQLMDADQSWKLLKQKVFTDGSPTLENIGKEIAKRCGGLPLTVVLVAGILSTVVKTPASWKKMAENVNSVVDGPLEEILSLSYTHLPHHLRPCFLFIGAYPEDHKINVSRLIKLWVAEGFLKCEDGYKKSLEEKAEKYLEDLVKRSLVLVISKKSSGKIKSCSLHDLVREMCIKKAREEKFLLNATTNNVPQARERRISVSHFQHLSYLPPTIHTLIHFYEPKRRCYIGSAKLDLLENSKLLRVFDSFDSYNMLLSQVFELFHLRYLAFGAPRDIPEAISKLENLQTLINTESYDTEPLEGLHLPFNIWRMPQLRHFASRFTYELPNPPEDGSTLPLDNLQSLSTIANLVCRGRILQMIPNLRKLVLAYSDSQEYQLHNLKLLHQLEKLKITAYHDFCWQRQNPAFPSALKKLVLVGGLLPWKKMTIVGSLPNLQVLKLRNYACDGDTWETIDGEFSQLIFLLIEKSHLQYWITDTSHLPALKCLVLHHCEYLNEIPESIGEIPTLELIEVDHWNQSVVDSARQIQEEQHDNGNDTLQVHCTEPLRKFRLAMKGSDPLPAGWPYPERQQTEAEIVVDDYMLNESVIAPYVPSFIRSIFKSICFCFCP